MGERGAQLGGTGVAAIAGSEVQQQVRVEAVPVGEPVHGDHGLDEVVLAAQVVGGAQRAGAAHVADPDRFAGGDPVAADEQSVVDSLAAAGDHDLGGDLAVRGAVRVEKGRGRVAGEHAPTLDEPVRAQGAQPEVGRVVAGGAVDVGEQPHETGAPEAASGRQARRDRKRTTKGHGPARYRGRHARSIAPALGAAGPFGTTRACKRRTTVVWSCSNSRGAPLTRSWNPSSSWAGVGSPRQCPDGRARLPAPGRLRPIRCASRGGEARIAPWPPGSFSWSVSTSTCAACSPRRSVADHARDSGARSPRRITSPPTHLPLPSSQTDRGAGVRRCTGNGVST